MPIRRFATAAVLCLLPLASQAASPLVAISGAFVDTVLTEQRQMCQARVPGSEAAWRSASERWHSANATQLAELDAILKALLKPDANGKPSHMSMTVTNLLLLSIDKSTRALAVANDARAAELCKEWIGLLAAGGPFETGLPETVAAARQLLKEQGGKP